jgi:hypothetical protein
MVPDPPPSISAWTAKPAADDAAKMTAIPKRLKRLKRRFTHAKIPYPPGFVAELEEVCFYSGMTIGFVLGVIGLIVVGVSLLPKPSKPHECELAEGWD